MKITLLVASSVLLLLAGCASSPVYQLTKLDQAQYANVPSETVVDNLQAKLVQAKTDRLDYYAPASFAKAQSAAAAIQGLPLDKSHRDEILQYAVLAQKAIEAGYAEKEKAVKVFADVLALDARLKALGAPALQPAQYKTLARRLGKLMGTLEQGGNAQSDQDSAALKGDMEALKIRITKQKSLGLARRLNKALQEDNAAALAPKSVQEAKESLERADAYIQMHPDDQGGIMKAAQTALIAARHAQWVSARVKQLSAMQTPPFEDIILSDEQRLASIGEILSVGDIRDKTLAQQTAVLAAQAKTVETALDKSTTSNTALNKQVSHCQSSAGTADTLSQQLQSKNALLKQKVTDLETNTGVLKNQLKLLQDILFAKTGQKMPEPAVAPVPAPQQVQSGKEQVESSAPAGTQSATKSAAAPAAPSAAPAGTPAAASAATATAPMTPAKTSVRKPVEASTTQAEVPAKTAVEPPAASAGTPAVSAGNSGESSTEQVTAPAKTTAEPPAASAGGHAVSAEKSAKAPAKQARAPAKAKDETHNTVTKAAAAPASASSPATDPSAAVVDKEHAVPGTGTAASAAVTTGK